MTKYLILLTIPFFIFFFTFFVFAQKNQVELYLFYGEGCPYCANTKSFLNDLQQKYPRLTVREYEVYNNQRNRELWVILCNAYKEKADGVPTIFIGEEVMVGFDASIGIKIEKEVKNCFQNGCILPIQKLQKSGSPNVIKEKGFFLQNKDKIIKISVISITALLSLFLTVKLIKKYNFDD